MRPETREQWRRRVAAWQASGLTCRDYAERARLNPSTLSWWKWRLSQDDSTEPEQTPEPRRLGFVELTPLLPQPTDARFDLRVGDIHLQVPPDFDPDTLHRLLDVLEARR